VLKLVALLFFCNQMNFLCCILSLIVVFFFVSLTSKLRMFLSYFSFASFDSGICFSRDVYIFMYFSVFFLHGRVCYHWLYSSPCRKTRHKISCHVMLTVACL
jgi:hypothetical protein